MDANKEIEIVINRFKSGDYEFTINKVSVLLKKFPNNSLNLQVLKKCGKGTYSTVTE